jgi:hypothetical protein
LAQTSDITGWHGVPWGSTKAALRKALGCNPSDIGEMRCADKLFLRDCHPVPTSTDPRVREREKQIIEIETNSYAERHKCEPTDADLFQIDGYPVNHIYYDVDIIFAKGYGLSGVILHYEYSDSSGSETALAELRDHYGDPTPVPKDDHFEWTWVKPHGNLSLLLYQGGKFMIVYSRKKDNNIL